MVDDRVWKALLTLAAVGAVVFLVFQLGFITPPWAEDRADVRVVDGDTGEELAVVDAEVADTYSDRYTGLSDHDDLPEGEGMLFVHSSEGERTYVMRDMDFDIDIVFVDADREITTIEHARAPEPDEDGNDLEHTGRAQYVLEVPRGYANETGMRVGDELEIEYR
ncbi:DUF192 domain-containing protein [Natronolimnohabitans innermongolicus]|uniref:DUF192 domain-containing protein n=1 Tax=Natronolimnohabitans innermongolicus JCM 12255 TaxID=1227499 RepID=L9X5I8_9EURY|nr:DUF192 domain-containing protein [Natronolimnohabitans innermongolicus]ELY57039.1 hypothetical protein C493_09433 [Natronolimnohabitans innermongolicus JCM 12255]